MSKAQIYPSALQISYDKIKHSLTVYVNADLTGIFQQSTQIT